MRIGDPITKGSISLSTAGIQFVDWEDLASPTAISGYTFVNWNFVSSTYRFCILGIGGSRLYYYVGTTYTSTGSIVAYPVYRKN